jgi:hypothetical protein
MQRSDGQDTHVSDVTVQILARVQRADGRRVLANVVLLSGDGATIEVDGMVVGEVMALVLVVPGDPPQRVFLPATIVDVQESRAELHFASADQTDFGMMPPTGIEGVSMLSSLAAVRGFVQRRGG